MHDPFNPEHFPYNLPDVILKELCSKMDKPNLFTFSLVSDNVEDTVMRMNLQGEKISFVMNGNSFEATLFLGGSAVSFVLSNPIQNPSKMVVNYHDKRGRVTYSDNKWETNEESIRSFIDQGLKIFNFNEINIKVSHANNNSVKWLMDVATGLKINLLHVSSTTLENFKTMLKFKQLYKQITLFLDKDMETEFTRCLKQLKSNEPINTEESFVEMLLNSCPIVKIVSCKQPDDNIAEKLTHLMINEHVLLKKFRFVFKSNPPMSFDSVLGQLNRFQTQVIHANNGYYQDGVQVYRDDKPIVTLWWHEDIWQELCFEVWQH